MGEDTFKDFLQFYMKQHSLTSITTIQLRETWEFFVERMIPGLSGAQVNQILAAVDWQAWMYESTLAPEPLDFSTPESDQAAQLALDYIALNGTGSPANYSAYFSYYSNLKVVFHDTLATNIKDVNENILERIDADLNCTADIDPEVKQRWYPVGLTLNYTPVYEPAHTWISSMGRSKYLAPVYQALQDSGQHDLAVQWNDENKDFYHPVAESSVLKIIGGSEAKEAEPTRFAALAHAVATELEVLHQFAEQALEEPLAFLQ